MKNFSDITAIDINGRLRVGVELIEHNNPEYNFTINENPVTSGETYTLGLLDDLRFACTIKSGAVEVAKITINGHEVLPIYQHLAKPATNWITTEWEFAVPGPFYVWYHQITGQGWTA